MSIIEQYREKLIGRKFDTNNCGVCEIIDYKNHREVTVKFENPEYVTVCRLELLKLGKVRNPLTPSFYGKGFIGLGEFGFKDKRACVLWAQILGRAYDKKFQIKRPTYKGVTVCKEWLNFQNFARWFYDQEFSNTKDGNGRSYHLDKDILVRGNKIYSPETCCFVPQDLNSLLLLRGKCRGDYPVGVQRISSNKFVSQMSKNGGKIIHLGTFTAPEQAFQAYKKAKEDYIKEVAEKWKGKISDKVYQALLGYEVNISD